MAASDVRSLDLSIRYVKGVGPKKALLFENLNIRTLRDLLDHFPFRIEDFSSVKAINLIQPGDEVTVSGRVFSVNLVQSLRGVALRVGLTDGKGSVFLVWYNMPYMRKMFRIGSRIVASGKVEWRRNSFEIAHPFWKEDSPLKGEESGIGRIIPVYHGTSSLPSSKIHSVIKNFLESHEDFIEDDIPSFIAKQYNLVPLKDAYREIHLPSSASAWMAARRTLGFREILYFQIGLALMKKEKEQIKSAPIIKDFSLADKFVQMLPFQLTSSQEKAICDIKEDFLSSKVMSRLLQGDVGSGKTVVAMWALLACVSSGYQGVFMVPTEVLARQHLRTFEKLASNMAGIHLLSGSLTQTERKKVLHFIDSGEPGIIIGTHALLEPDINWRNLGLVVTDEQHRFGVYQRVNLAQKNMTQSSFAPHVLVMSATPIPRSLALTLFGDMDISVIDSMPRGRKKVVTRVLNQKDRKIAYDRVRLEVNSGKKAYVVCPVIREGKIQRKAAEDLFVELSAGYLKGIKLGLIHGDMPKNDIDKEMNRFLQGDISVLVSTTVIEVGIDVQDATCMVVEDADSFGLATLHQLRGRVGRGTAESYCFFIVSRGSERIKKLETINDGFEVAELDLVNRGPGEFFGSRQHGITEFNLENLGLSLETVMQAREAASIIVSSNDDECKKLVNKVKLRFGDLALKSLSR